jgi:hypothetical protein
MPGLLHRKAKSFFFTPGALAPGYAAPHSNYANDLNLAAPHFTQAFMFNEAYFLAPLRPEAAHDV